MDSHYPWEALRLRQMECRTFLSLQTSQICSATLGQILILTSRQTLEASLSLSSKLLKVELSSHSSLSMLICNTSMLNLDKTTPIIIIHSIMIRKMNFRKVICLENILMMSTRMMRTKNRLILKENHCQQLIRFETLLTRFHRIGLRKNKLKKLKNYQI